MRLGRPKVALILTDEERVRLDSLAHRFRTAALRWRADQRLELEQLCDYITRPAIAKERLKRNRAGQVVLQLKSAPTEIDERARPSRMPTACLVKPGVARRDFLGSTWDFSQLRCRLQPAATGRPG